MLIISMAKFVMFKHFGGSSVIKTSFQVKFEIFGELKIAKLVQSSIIFLINSNSVESICGGFAYIEEKR
jgi:hypothetical protein